MPTTGEINKLARSVFLLGILIPVAYIPGVHTGDFLAQLLLIWIGVFVFFVWNVYSLIRRHANGVSDSHSSLHVIILSSTLLILLFFGAINATNKFNLLWSNDNLARNFWLFMGLLLLVVQLALADRTKRNSHAIIEGLMQGYVVRSLIVLIIGLFGIRGINYNPDITLLGAVLSLVYFLSKEKYREADYINIGITVVFLIIKFTTSLFWPLVLTLPLGILYLYRNSPNREVINYKIKFYGMLIIWILSVVNLLMVKPVAGQLSYPESITLMFNTYASQPSSALYGLGVGNVNYALISYRPSSLNTSVNWEVNSVQNAGQMFTDGVEMGAIFTTIMLVVFLLIIYQLIFNQKDNFKLINEHQGPYILVSLVLLVSYFTSKWQIDAYLLLFLLANAYLQIPKFNFLNSQVPDTESDFTIYSKSIVSLSMVPVIILICPFLVSYPAITGAVRRMPNVMEYIPQVITASITEYTYDQAIAINDARIAYEKAAELTKISRESAKYHQQLALISLEVAKLIAISTPGLESQLAQLYSQSVNEIVLATEAVNPYDLSLWESRLGIYKELIGKFPGSELQYEQTLRKIVNISPNNPKYLYVLAQTLSDKFQLEEALSIVNRSISEKSNYWDAYILRADIYQFNGQFRLALEDVTQIINNAPKDSLQYNKAAAELVEINIALNSGRPAQ